MACRGLIHAVERKIAGLLAEREEIEREILKRAAVPAADFQNLGRYRLRACAEEIELAAERRQRLLSAEEQRLRVQRAQRRVELLEKTRDRRLEEHTADVGRELENMAADAYLSRWSQSQRAN